VSFRLLSMVLGSVVTPLVAAVLIAMEANPMGSLQMASVGVLVVLALLGAGITSFLTLAPVRRDLRQIAQSMREFGDDEGPGWLPLPRGDVMEDLSVATGEMANRVKELVRRVDEQGRLAVVGELASHIAHEIRNPLSSIHMNLQSIERMVARGAIDPDAPDMIRVSLQEVRRLNAVVGSVLEMGEGTPPIREDCSLHEIVDGSLGLMAPEFSRNEISLDWRPGAMVDRVYADPSRIRGVLLNLYVNALDAQPDGGALRMSSDLVLGSEGPAIRLLVEDAGPGIPKANRDRIFQPFFTTKSGGSGIGLAISRETLRIHGGDLTLESGSSPAAGAAFSLTLPVAESALEGFDRAWLTERTSPQRPDDVPPTLRLAKG
jgi:signal transduction histidine kinase